MDQFVKDIKKIYENTCTLLKSCPELIIKLFAYSFFKNVNIFRLECVCVYTNTVSISNYKLKGGD